MWRSKKQHTRIQPLDSPGYTIVEVFIFLAISSALAVGALATLSGQQRRTEFAQATREAESRINDVMNDFVTGFSPSPSTDCSGNIPGSEEQGENFGCTYIGKVIQFNPAGGDDEDIRIFSVIGRQFKAPGTLDPVENIVEAMPIVLSFEDTSFGYGLSTESVKVNGTGDIGAIGFFSSFAEIPAGTGGSSVASGKQITTVIPIPDSRLNQDYADIVAAIEGLVSYTIADLNNNYISKPVKVCFLGGSNQRASIAIGDNQQRTATKLTIDDTTCP